MRSTSSGRNPYNFFLPFVAFLSSLIPRNVPLASWLRASDIGLPRYVVKAAAEKTIANAKAKRARIRARNRANGTGTLLLAWS